MSSVKKIMFASLACLGAGLPLLESAKAELVIGKAMSSEAAALDQWVRDFGLIIEAIENEEREDSETGYTECRPLLAMPHVWLCQFQHFTYMNKTLARASYFAESSPRQTLLAQNSSVLQTQIRQTNGHDLTREGLLGYLAAVKQESADDKRKGFNQHESELVGGLLQEALHHKELRVLIAFSYHSRAPYREIVSHEMAHAHYFSDPEYRKAVADFWQDHISLEDQEAIKKLLASQYDTTNSFVVLNEFQAYLLQENASRHLLKDYVDTYAARLAENLTAH